MILFGATLGAGADFLLRRYGVLDMGRAVVMQAASAAMIESYCNLENRRLEEEYRKQGMALCPRFSPGYGDFPLSFQEKFAAALELEKTVGITLTEGFLMMPSKSVTAVIGVKEERGKTPGRLSASARPAVKQTAFTGRHRTAGQNSRRKETALLRKQRNET
ncbi:MAG: vitamin B12 dependent-methionine synthase activation domain-containing protein [Clostridium sp.]